MINLSPDCKQTQIAQPLKVQEAQNMKGVRHEMHLSMSGLKHLKQVRNEEHKST